MTPSLVIVGTAAIAAGEGMRPSANEGRDAVLGVTHGLQIIGATRQCDSMANGGLLDK